MKKFLTMFLCLITLFSSFAYAADFSDLPSTHWAYENVMSLVNDGVINGYTDGTYKPQKQVTRGEFFKLLMVASEGEEAFANVENTGGHWAYPYAIFAYRNGLLMENVYIGNLNEPITRLEMAIVLARTVIYKDIMPNSFVDISGFADIDNLESMQINYIKYIARRGLINRIY